MIRAFACFVIVVSFVGCEKSQKAAMALQEATTGIEVLSLQALADGEMVTFRAAGDGVADDTAAIQALLDSSLSIKLPKPKVAFRVGTLRLRQNHDITGPGKNVPCLKGLNKGTVLLLGDDKDATKKAYNVSIRDLNIYNEDFPAIGIYNSSNYYIGQSFIKSFRTNTIEIRNSYRGVIENNFLGQSGPGWVISAMDNVNSTTIAKNIITGGSAGNGIDIGRSQSLRIRDNTMEVGAGYGIRIGGYLDTTVSGVCSGIDISGNYLEQVKTPISLGEQWVVRGVVVSNNYAANNENAASTIVEKTGFIILGRVASAQVHSNIYGGSDKEPFIVFYKRPDAPSEGQMYDSTVENNSFVHVASAYSLQNFTAGLTAQLVQNNKIQFTAAQGGPVVFQ